MSSVFGSDKENSNAAICSEAGQVSLMYRQGRVAVILFAKCLGAGQEEWQEQMTVEIIEKHMLD